MTATPDHPHTDWAPNLPASFILRGTAADSTLRLVAVDSTAIVEEARLRHHLSKTATAALGRSLSAALLLAIVLGKKTDSRVTLRIQGDGPIGWIVAEGSANGQVRGYVRDPGADLPIRERDGKLDVSGIVGTDGEIAVTRLLDNAEPWTGSVPLVSGEIAEDVAKYLMASEQIPSAVLLGVYEEGGRVSRSGGLLVQAMPGASDETLERLEANIRNMGPITDNLRQRSLLEVMELAAEGLGLQVVAQAQAASFRCRCSRQKARNSLLYFGMQERQEMMQEGGQEVVCHWCNEHYQITPDEIAALDDQDDDRPHAQA